ncbi:MAG: hypothetical protein AB1762_11410 [Gemmatimonadota bacterium]
MNMRLLLLLCVALGYDAYAQSLPKRSEQELKALYETHSRDFDYLLGDWEFTADNKEYGKARGFWSAVRLAPGGEILDEYRIVGDSGETWYVSATIRSYNAVLDQWELISTDRGRGLHDFGTARRVGPEMHIEQTFGVMSEEPSRWRIRYYNIQPERFSWRADRSTDSGKTWVTDYLRIEARRVGPARELGALAPARKFSIHP